MTGRSDAFPLLIAEPVSRALAVGGPVVALESTIITHGMPAPRNVETALAVEAEVRTNGATPATIALIDGAIRVGLDDSEIESLGRAPDAVKASRRDIAYVLHRRLTGGTTVAATMAAAHLAGIRVFATGGIGGVHRGAERTFDISADLQELARTPVTVVSAGFKSILDIGLTLEYLETMGVPVLGFRTRFLPAFYARESAFPLDQTIDGAEEVASIMRIGDSIGTRAGIVVANPPPGEDAMDPDVIEAAIETAVAEVEQAGVGGKEATPFLLERVSALTGAASLDANVALVRDNARLAAAIAVAFADD